MSTLLVGKSDESYLIKCAQEQKFTYGIIIGHQAEPDKIVVVHLAKNNEEDVDVVDFHETLKIEDIDSQALTNQWMSAYKMCPGSFAVMGIFVTAERASIIDEKTDEFKNAKKLLNSIHQMLYSTNNNYCGALDYDSYPNLIFLAYSVQAREAICKSYTHSDNGGTFSPMQVRFVEKPFEWHIIECTYELDDIYPITKAAQDTDKGINVEVQFQKSIARIRDSLADSEIFLQQEHVDDNQLLVDYHKEQLQIQKRRGEEQQRKSYVATILVPLTKPVPQPSTPPQSQSSSGSAAIKAHNGTIRYRGIISSRIWCNPRNTLANVKSFIRNDVVRSLAARIQMYCDGLTEPFINSQTAYLSEPPRRVYFELPHATPSTTTIQFSDYIFRGESATVAVAQAKQILDIDVQSEAIVANLEGLPDDNLYMNGGDGCDDEGNSEKNGKQHGKQQAMSVARYYFLGIGAAFLMLCMAIAAQLWLR